MVGKRSSRGRSSPAKRARISPSVSPSVSPLGSDLGLSSDGSQQLPANIQSMVLLLVMDKDGCLCREHIPVMFHDDTHISFNGNTEGSVTLLQAVYHLVELAIPARPAFGEHFEAYCKELEKIHDDQNELAQQSRVIDGLEIPGFPP